MKKRSYRTKRRNRRRRTSRKLTRLIKKTINNSKEIKFFGQQANNLTGTAATAIGFSNESNVAEGTGANERIGNEIEARYFSVVGTVTATSTNDMFFRILTFWAHSNCDVAVDEIFRDATNGNDLTIAQVEGTLQSLTATLNKKMCTYIGQTVFRVNGSGGDFTNKMFKVQHRLGNKVLRYEGSGTGNTNCNAVLTTLIFAFTPNQSLANQNLATYSFYLERKFYYKDR